MLESIVCHFIEHIDFSHLDIFFFSVHITGDSYLAERTNASLGSLNLPSKWIESRVVFGRLPTETMGYSRDLWRGAAQA